MDQNNYIQAFINSNNPSKEQTAYAYYHRDLIMNISLQEAFQKSTEKLAISPEGRIQYIDNLFKLHVNNYLKDFLINKNNLNHEINFNYDEFYNNQINTQRYINAVNKYNELYQYFQNEDHLGFYMALTINDLCSLGF